MAMPAGPLHHPLCGGWSPSPSKAQGGIRAVLTLIADSGGMQSGFAHRLARRGAVFGRAGASVSSRRWRGLAALGLSSMGAAMIGIAMAPLAAASARHPGGDSERLQHDALAIAPIAAGSVTGLRMVASEAVAPLDVVPGRPWIDLELRTVEGEHFAAMLARAGASNAEAGEAAALIRAEAPGGIAAGTIVSLRLGQRGSAGSRPIERIALRAGMALDLTIARGEGGGLSLSKRALPVDSTPVRIRGRAGEGLYWSLRAAGASPATAAEYLQALATEIDVGVDVGPDDRFDLVLAHRRIAGESRAGPLLYAGLERSGERRLQLVRWNVAGQARWIEAASLTEARPSEPVWPVAGRISSGFGYRIHPILRFARFHSGVDFAAPWGTPIVASADGRVTAAGWNGGYGRQVRIAHGDGMVTTYSHMSGIAAEPGSFVRSGQLIGYVGSSGFSTGPHLHYEVHQHGRAINPLGVRFAASRPMFDDGQRSAFEARLKALLSVGDKRG